MSEVTINDFSLLCRLFGNLFYRNPTDPVLAGVFNWLQQGQLRQHWALATDTQSEQALTILEKEANPTELAVSYQALFAENGNVSPRLSDYGIDPSDFMTFRQQRNMPEVDNVNHVGLLLLTASWIEDNIDSIAAQKALFETFLLPCLSKFLGKVEAFDTGFYKALAQLTRDALSAMADELEESE
ncbi:TorD/DmsD family molecular chaperone [Otariodibacter oris]|uniref:TorA maturation chaperone TorD n=1 Tax=Otariodibacter oris TaxID=1032623 RepID=A0A420XJR2_9PAST|nr:molecular chaperone [Otariodibacter oris]QGM80381.1 hypothetical protein A6A10_02695 [Otariodibacter oris]RKR77479.1 TorA maturation chaperone TorD [Otariodibacter oris]